MTESSVGLTAELGDEPGCCLSPLFLSPAHSLSPSRSLSLPLTLSLSDTILYNADAAASMGMIVKSFKASPGFLSQDRPSESEP